MLIAGETAPGSWQGEGAMLDTRGPGWPGSTTCPLPQHLPDQDLPRGHQPTVHTWEGRQLVLITWDTLGPPTDATTLPESLKVTVGNTS